MTLDSVVSPEVLQKYLVLVDVKSGRFKYQSRRAGDETKERKSPAKSGRVNWHLCFEYRKVVSICM